MADVAVFGLVGSGIIGSGWAARALARGLDVISWDPDPDFETKLRERLENAWPALEALGLFPGASKDRLRAAARLEEVAEAADFVQESAPERIELKTRLHAAIDRAAGSEVIIASSTSGLLPSEFQAECENPERVLVGHPFNPVYLLPLVEVLGGERTRPECVDRAIEFYTDLGMHPLRVRREIPGFLADRLQEALWREALHLVAEGVATTEELDAAIAYGPGLRWALWGTCLHFHLAGGDGGMRQMLEHFDPSLFPWSRLEPPAMSEELIRRLAEGCEEQAAGRSVRELERVRDEALIGILRALEERGLAAGRTLAEHRRGIPDRE